MICSICPNCLTNEWNDNKDQVCIHCHLNLKHIDFEAEVVEKNVFTYKNPQRLAKENFHPIIWIKYPWVMSYKLSANNGNWSSVHVRSSYFWEFGCGNKEEGAYYGFVADYINLYDNVKNYIKTYPVHNIKDLILQTKI